MFSIKEMIGFGWQKTKGNFWKVLGFMVIALLPSAIIEILNYVNDKTDSLSFAVLLFLLILAINILSIILSIGLLKVLLRMHDGENPSAGEIFSSYDVFWKYIGVSILYGLIVIGGLILLIVPGIIWAIKFSFAPIIVVDRKIGPIAALKESGLITNGYKWKLIAFGVVTGLIMLLGYLALLVGSLVSIPITIFAWIHLYRTLTERLTPILPSV